MPSDFKYESMSLMSDYKTRNFQNNKINITTPKQTKYRITNATTKVKCNTKCTC